MTIREPYETERESWDAATTHPLQSWAWGDFRRAMGTSVLRLAVTEKNSINGAWQITFHAIPHSPFTIGYFPKGPQPTSLMADNLKRYGIAKGAISIQIEPNVEKVGHKKATVPNMYVTAHRPLFTKYTFILDLTKSEDTLLTAMHPKTRYNIRIAKRHNVIVREDNSDRAFEEYLALTHETITRQKFYAHNDKYHRTMWRIMSKAGIARLWTARFEDETLATWIVFVWKDTLYYPYGASSRNNRNTMAPNLLLWELALWGKRQGLKRFDLWGALGPGADPRDQWYGFHKFKEGYNPLLTEYIGSYDLVIQPTLYGIYTMADSLRWMYLNMKKRLR